MGQDRNSCLAAWSRFCGGTRRKHSGNGVVWHWPTSSKCYNTPFGGAKVPILNDNISTGNWAKMDKVAGLYTIGIEVGRRLGFHDVG